MKPPRSPRKSIDPDAALVAQLRRTDTGAAEALVGAYGDRVYRLAIGITGNASDAEEVVQDAFWSVLRNVGTFRGDASLGSWIHRIVVNAAYRNVRRRRHRRDDICFEVHELFFGRLVAENGKIELLRESVNLVEVALGVFPNGLADYTVPLEHTA